MAQQQLIPGRAITIIIALNALYLLMSEEAYGSDIINIHIFK